MKMCVRFAILAVLVFVPGMSFAGTVRGVLRVPPQTQLASVASLNPYPGSAGAMPGCHMPPRGSVTDAVIYLEGAPAGSGQAPSADAPMPRLAQKNQSFVPRVVAVARGTTVDFPNMDPIFHNVFSVSPTRRFDLGKYRKGHSKQVTFDRAGLVKVYCDIHSDMEAFVLVLPDRCFSRPEPSGSYAIPDVPPGRYKVKVWHPDLPDLDAEVVVPEKGDATLNLGY